jgi:hypothetical protein
MRRKFRLTQTKHSTFTIWLFLGEGISGPGSSDKYQALLSQNFEVIQRVRQAVSGVY